MFVHFTEIEAALLDAVDLNKRAENRVVAMLPLLDPQY